MAINEQLMNYESHPFILEIKEQNWTKPYKWVMILGMCNRGFQSWADIITAEELSLFFFYFQIDNDKLRKYSFNEKTREGWDDLTPSLRKEITKIIKKGPFNHWTGKYGKNNERGFSINLGKDKHLRELFDVVIKTCIEMIFNHFKVIIKFQPGLISDGEKARLIYFKHLNQKSYFINRKGQLKYRSALLKKYNQKCVICNQSIKQILKASHIKPFSKCEIGEHFDKENGLLLCSTHDDLFDKGLISFDCHGTLLVSNKIKNNSTAMSKLNLDSIDNISKNQCEYIKYHNKNVFIDVANKN